MEKNVLKVRMLGTFSLEYKGKELVLDRNKASKTTQLFQLLMFHTEDGGISKAAMIDALYGRVEVENKNGSLNNTIFRLRKQLKDIGLPDSKYINIQSGMCCWDGNIEVQVDVNEFRKLIEKEKKEKREEDKLHLWMQAWKIYKGENRPSPCFKTSRARICILLKLWFHSRYRIWRWRGNRCLCCRRI